MKKILLSLVMVFLTISVKAQVTWNVRAGGGYFETANIHVSPIVLAAQSNIPLFKRTSRFTFSPTFIAAVMDECQISFPLYFGYKKSMRGYRNIFFPKIGLLLGYDGGFESFMLGPSFEFAFELKHFICSLNFSANSTVNTLYDDSGGGSIFITAGYKF